MQCSGLPHDLPRSVAEPNNLRESLVSVAHIPQNPLVVGFAHDSQIFTHSALRLGDIPTRNAINLLKVVDLIVLDCPHRLVSDVLGEVNGSGADNEVSRVAIVLGVIESVSDVSRLFDILLCCMLIARAFGLE